MVFGCSGLIYGGCGGGRWEGFVMTVVIFGAKEE